MTINGWLGRIVVLASATLVSCVAITASLPAIAVAQTCPAAHPVNYLEPLEGLPRVRQIPENQRIPFAPKHLVARLSRPLLAGGGRIGVDFGSDRPDSSFRLGWTVEMTVSRINAAGAVKRVIGERRLDLSRRRSYSEDVPSMGVPVPGHRSLYRSDLTIRRSGHAPITYSQYVRVVPVKVDVVLQLSKTKFSPGEVIGARVANRGTTMVSYGSGFKLEMWSNGRWAIVAPKADHISSLGPAIGIPAGATGACEPFILATDMQPGAYRLVKVVNAGLAVRAYLTVL